MSESGDSRMNSGDECEAVEKLLTWSSGNPKELQLLSLALQVSTLAFM